MFPGVRLGDGQDNDCDGTVDEEVLNGEGMFPSSVTIEITIIVSITL